MSTSGSSNVQRVGVTAAELNAHTEQALIELVYIQTANDMLGSALANLESALNTTQSILNILQGLQNLHNQIKVKSKSAFKFNFLAPSGVLGNPSGGFTIAKTTIRNTSKFSPNPVTSLSLFTNVVTLGADIVRATIHLSGKITDYQKAYNKAASAYFGQAIDPFFAFSGPNAKGYSEFVNTLKSLKQKLNAEIAILARQTPPDVRNDPTSLLGTLKKVYAGLPKNFQFATVEKWVVDNYNIHGSTGTDNAGSIQNDITFAITAAEALNDTQKERVRRYLFIFQEYYQSAAAILSKITQITEMMAQKISS